MLILVAAVLANERDERAYEAVADGAGLTNLDSDGAWSLNERSDTKVEKDIVATAEC
jgi:hypothetical protein